MITPALSVGKVMDRLAVNGGVREAQLIQCSRPCEQVRRALGPVPRKQADPRGLCGIQRFATHQPGHRGAGINAAVPGLYVVVQAPIELALHKQVQRL
ncbi:hypothetical protein D3C85_1364340 [compost metagenome]